MATYVIGDVQGCFQSLTRLLKHIQFDQKNDVLWFTGDLVNRGSESLAVLRFVSSLGSQHITVLGNHDLHLLAVADGTAKLHAEDTLQEILASPDRDQLLHWLINRPLLHYDEHVNVVLTHAGIAPCWTLHQAILLAKEVENILHGDKAHLLLSHLYGNQPDLWDDGLEGYDRYRCIVNYFTRMRLCDEKGRLDFAYKGTLQHRPTHLFPWFAVPNCKVKDVDIVFGHWAALGGEVNVPRVYALDTGCVYGNKLTALCLETRERFFVKCWRIDTNFTKNS